MQIDISIIIPTKNAGDGFDDCLSRIFTQKTNYKYEVIVIDSGSTDSTLDIILDFRSYKNLGASDQLRFATNNALIPINRIYRCLRKHIQPLHITSVLTNFLYFMSLNAHCTIFGLLPGFVFGLYKLFYFVALCYRRVYIEIWQSDK